MTDKNHARLLAAATLVRSALRDLETGQESQGYYLPRLVDAARKLANVVDALNAQESTGSSGSVLPG